MKRVFWFAPLLLCIGAMLAGCGGGDYAADDPDDGRRNIQPITCAASGVCIK